MVNKMTNKLTGFLLHLISRCVDKDSCGPFSASSCSLIVQEEVIFHLHLSLGSFAFTSVYCNRWVDMHI